MNKAGSVRMIGRFCQYRRMLARLAREGAEYVFSHDLADMAHVTASQVRRDMMALGVSGNPAKGYKVGQLLQCIGNLLDHPQGQSVVLVGVGNLGRALLAFFADRMDKLRFVAAFDVKAELAGRLLHGCPCYPVAELPRRVRESGASVGVIAVPAVAAQQTAEQLVDAGVTGLLNFAPVRLRVPAGVYVEDIDVAACLERAAYLARLNAHDRQGVR